MVRTAKRRTGSAVCNATESESKRMMCWMPDTTTQPHDSRSAAARCVWGPWARVHTHLVAVRRHMPTRLSAGGSGATVRRCASIVRQRSDARCALISHSKGREDAALVSARFLKCGYAFAVARAVKVHRERRARAGCRPVSGQTAAYAIARCTRVDSDDCSPLCHRCVRPSRRTPRGCLLPGSGSSRAHCRLTSTVETGRFAH
jgi:hypothetical protein